MLKEVAVVRAVALHGDDPAFHITQVIDLPFLFPDHNDPLELVVRLGIQKMLRPLLRHAHGGQRVQLPGQCLVIGFGPGETRGRVEAQAADPADQVKVFGGDAGILSFLIKKLIGNELRVDPQPDDRMLPDKAGLLLRPHGPFLGRGSAGGRQGENRHAQI